MQTVPFFRDGKTYTSNSNSPRRDDSNDTKWAPESFNGLDCNYEMRRQKYIKWADGTRAGDPVGGGVEEPRSGAKLYILLNAPGTETRYLLGRTSPDVICLLFFHFNWTAHTNRHTRKKVYRGLGGWGGGGGSANIKTYPINAALLNISSAPLFAEWPPSVALNEMKSVGKCFIYRFASVAIM